MILDDIGWYWMILDDIGFGCSIAGFDFWEVKSSVAFLICWKVGFPSWTPWGKKLNFKLLILLRLRVSDLGFSRLKPMVCYNQENMIQLKQLRWCVCWHPKIGFVPRLPELVKHRLSILGGIPHFYTSLKGTTVIFHMKVCVFLFFRTCQVRVPGFQHRCNSILLLLASSLLALDPSTRSLAPEAVGHAWTRTHVR